MKYIFTLLCSVIFLLPLKISAQAKLDIETAARLSLLPLHCIPVEFPNKTSHLSDGKTDAQLLPHELHPVFYGCLDWHSSLHGHWMLIRLLKEFPELPGNDEIISVLNNSFQIDKMKMEAEYFGKYTASGTYERTYGWAWLLKLDQELLTWKNNPNAVKWHEALQPLTQKIITLWKAYLPKQTYPSRVGTHTNTAFGLCFALDWARTSGDTSFANSVIKKAKYFYLNEKQTPAYMEPDGADFFSPSLEVADLMRRVLPQQKFVKWLDEFYTKRSIERLCEKPVVSDRSDYQTIHLDGLSFTRTWCMKGIASALPTGHPLKSLFKKRAQQYLDDTLPEITNGGYGGEHWLASFAIYAMAED
ncbi:MAG: DUF2891 domain-containing protein [Ginsengibacter sp.]